MKYRPEIDGLRAIAVVSVLFYHAEFVVGGSPLLPGGFLGVDIFLVISGFLITGIIRDEIQQQSFGFARFYERRARRILPALFALILVLLPVAWLVMLPEALQEFSQTVIAAVLFCSNVLFWLQDGYTAEPSALKPLLHTWSLGVEEQFYLFFPVVLILVFKVRRGLRQAVLWTLFGASLMAAEFASVRYPEGNFFLIPFRFWELMAGAMLALATYHNKIERLWAQTASALGLGLIIASLLWFDETTRHPSLLTLAPVLGTVLLIGCCKSGTLIYHLLANKVMVGIGLISYSLYLWHFPLFAFSKLLSLELDNLARGVLLLVSVALAYVSYRFVEQPFRDKTRVSVRSLVVILSSTAALVVAAQTLVVAFSGFPQRLGNVAQMLTELEPEKVENGVYSQQQGRITLLNVGDSHADMYASQLKHYAEANDLNFAQMVQSGCPLVKGIYRFDHGKPHHRCNPSRTDKWLNSVLQFENGIVIYSARFNLYWNGKRFADHQGNVEPGPPIVITPDPNGQPNPAALANKFKETINTLLAKGMKVVLVYPSPEIGWHVPREVSNELKSVPETLQSVWLKNLRLTMPYDLYVARSEQTRDVYDSLGQHPNLARVYPALTFCVPSENVCHTKDEHGLYYYDDNHLSAYAAGKIVDKISNVIGKAGWLTTEAR